MKNFVSSMAIFSALLLSSCSSTASPGGVGARSPIPKEPMPGSPAAEMQQQQTAPGGQSSGGGAR